MFVSPFRLVSLCLRIHSNKGFFKICHWDCSNPGQGATPPYGQVPGYTPPYGGDPYAAPYGSGDQAYSGWKLRPLKSWISVKMGNSVSWRWWLLYSWGLGMNSDSFKAWSNSKRHLLWPEMWSETIHFCVPDFQAHRLFWSSILRAYPTAVCVSSSFLTDPCFRSYFPGPVGVWSSRICRK